MFKTFMKYFIFLLYGIVGGVLCLLVYTPTPQVEASSTIQGSALKSQETPAATNATITIMQPGGNSGTVSGHPGTKVQIVGNGFQANNTINIYITPDTTKCAADNTDNLQAFNPRTITAKGDGTFQINAQWPASSGPAGTTYYICAIDTAATTAIISSTSFTLAQDVTVTITTSAANPGDKVTITGENWLPAQQLAVSITGGQGTSSIVSGQTNSNATGSFSIDLTIPQGTKGGSYGISVVAINEQSLNTYKDNIITINAAGNQATPTATSTTTPTAEATPTPASTATPTTTATDGGNGNTGGGASNGGTAGMTLLIFTLGGLGILLVIVGLIMFVSYSKTS